MKVLYFNKTFRYSPVFQNNHTDKIFKHFYGPQFRNLPDYLQENLSEQFSDFYTVRFSC